MRAASLTLALVWFGFLAAGAGHGSLIPPGEDDVTVVSANLLLTNSSLDEAAAALERTGADIIVTLETTPSFRVALERRWSGSYEPVARGGLDADDIAIWSRVPVDVLSPVRVCDRLLPVVSVRRPGSSFTLSVVGVHLTSPSRRSVVAPWRCELDALRAATAPSDAVVLAGDFNASLNHAGLRNPRIGGLALHDAARASGELFEPTWPMIAGTGSPVAVALLDLDHVLVGGAGVSAYERFEVPGSDHAALKVSVGPLRQG